MNKDVLIGKTGGLFQHNGFAYCLRLDRNQDLVVEYRYDPWGKMLETICAPENELANQALSVLNPFRYRGYAFDDETQLYYLRSRFYNPDWKRFVNEDSIIGETRKPLAHNMFAYCENRPVMMLDPSGTNGFTDFMGDLGSSFKNFFQSGWDGYYGRSAAVWNDPSLYNIGNMVTYGLVAQTDRAWHPEEPFSAQHWKDSFWAALGWTSYGISGYGMAGGTSLLNPGTPNIANAKTYGYGINFKEAYRAPARTITQGVSQAPLKGVPLSEYIQVNAKGKTISHTAYNALGMPGQRLDLLRSHRGGVPHLHVFKYNAAGQRNLQAIYVWKENTMSEICYGVISKMPKDSILPSMKADVSQLCEQIGIDISWEIPYPEPFMTEKMLKTGSVFELTIDEIAETLLAPDWYKYNGYDNKEPFKTRMEKIQSILSMMLMFVPSVDVFLGYDGALHSDYEYFEVSIHNIVSLLSELFEKCKAGPPQVCLHVTNESV